MADIPKTAKVSVLEAPRKMVIHEVPIPAIGDDEILVKVEGVGICGTDVHEFKGDPFGYCPVQLGHEGTGEIVALGKNVTKDYTGKPLKVGDKIVTGLKPCGKCDTCKFDPEHIHLCEGGEIFGLMPGPDHYLNGWFGEYMKVNAGGVVFNVSDMDRDLRILIEPAAVIVHAVEQAKKIFDFKFDSYVLVQGCGPIGLLLLTMVRCLGVRNIIACDGDANRLEMAKRLGARYTVNGMEADATEMLAGTEVLGMGYLVAFYLQLHQAPAVKAYLVALAQVTSDGRREAHHHGGDSAFAETFVTGHLLDNLTCVNGLAMDGHGLVSAKCCKRWLGLFLQFVFHITVFFCF